MIHSLKVLNFQSHKDTTIIFGDGVNIFVGQSDSGKTAILRALRWVINNKPSGDAFRSNWGGTTSVELELKNGTKVTRVKSNSTNEYKLELKGEKELVFKAFGQDVPSEIQEALSFSDINIQNQLDSPYLLSDTPGQVAKHFNKIAKLEKIDTGIAKVQSSINSTNQDIKTNKTNIAEYKEEYKKWDYLDDFENDLVKVESKISSIDEMRVQSKNLLNTLEQLEDVTEDLIDYEEVIQHEKKIDIILGKYSVLKSKQKIVKTILDISNSIKRVKHKQKTFKVKIQFEHAVNDLLERYEEMQKHTKELSSVNKLVRSISNVRNEQESTLKDLKEKEKYYKDNFPEICPLCNTKLK